MPVIKRGILSLLAFSAMISAQEIFWLESAYPVPRLLRASLPSGSPDTMFLSNGSFPQQLTGNFATRSLYWGELIYRNARFLSAPRNFASTPSTGADSLSSFRGIALDAGAGFLYWTSTDLSVGSKIWRSRLNGDSAIAIVSFAAGSKNAPFGLALDTASDSLYWANFPAGKIQSAPAQIGAPVTDRVTGLGGPVGITIESNTRQMYWTESNAGRIQRSDLSGANTALLVSGLGRPTYLALDTASGKMFWSESQSSTIRSANLDGTGMATVRNTGSMPTGLLVLPSPPTRIASSLPARGMPKGLTLAGFETQAGFLNIAVGLPQAGNFAIDALDFKGRNVRELMRGTRAAGWHILSLPDPMLPAGSYLLRVRSGNTESEHCCLIRR